MADSSAGQTTRALSLRLDETVPLNPLSAERHETARNGTVWTVIQSDENGGRRQRQNVLTEAAGPTVHAKFNIEDSPTSFLCLVDEFMLKHIRDSTVAETHSQGGQLMGHDSQ